MTFALDVLLPPLLSHSELRTGGALHLILLWPPPFDGRCFLISMCFFPLCGRFEQRRGSSFRSAFFVGVLRVRVGGRCHPPTTHSLMLSSRHSRKRRTICGIWRDIYELEMCHAIGLKRFPNQISRPNRLLRRDRPDVSKKGRISIYSRPANVVITKKSKGNRP